MTDGSKHFVDIKKGPNNHEFTFFFFITYLFLLIHIARICKCYPRSYCLLCAYNSP